MLVFSVLQPLCQIQAFSLCFCLALCLLVEHPWLTQAEAGRSFSILILVCSVHMFFEPTHLVFYDWGKGPELLAANVLMHTVRRLVDLQ